MAAGRHGGYRENEFRVREPDMEASSRKDYSQDRPREGGRGRRRSRGIRDRTDGGSIAGAERSPLSSNSGGLGGSGRKRTHLSSVVDREPGELSSGSGSEDHERSVKQRGDKALQKQENGDSSEMSKKRKFSPIIWDLDERERPNVDDSRRKYQTVVLPPPPPLPHGYVPTRIVRHTPEKDSPSDVNASASSPQDQELRDDQEPGQLDEEEEEGYAQAPNISTSRWADGNGALEDVGAEAEIEETIPKRRSKSLTNYVDQKLQEKVLSPEVWREGSGCSGSKSSDSSGEHGEGSQEIGTDKKDYKDVDSEQADGDETDHNTESEGNKGSVRTPEPVNPPQRSINMLQGCRSVDEFERLNKIDEGTYGVVYRAKDKKGGEVVALKKVKMEKEREGFPLTSLREINILLSFHHPSIVDVKEVVVGSSLDSVFMVMEYMEHDLKGLMETMKQPFSQSEVKCLMLQLLEGVKYLHDNWVLHRDLKTSNLLLNNRGELKICDFGLSRQYGFPLKPYTHLVVTLWYRAPELLLGAKEYSTAIDMWSLGCIMAELLAKEPLFSGKTEFDQLDKIFRILGTPNEKIWPGFSKLPGVKVNFVKQPYNKLREKFPPTSFSGRPTLSEAGFDLLNKLLTYDPDKRITAESALKHNWFQEVPLPKSKDFMPTFPAQHAQDRRLRKRLKSPDPLEEQRRKELQQGDLDAASLFG